MEQQNYDKIQLTTLSRYQNDISVRQILDIKDGHLIMHTWNNGEDICRIPVSKQKLALYHVGDFVDMVILRTGNSSYTARLVGHTPPDFCPAE